MSILGNLQAEYCTRLVSLLYKYTLELRSHTYSVEGSNTYFNHEECGGEQVRRLSNLCFVRGWCIPSIRRPTGIWRDFSLHSLISLPLQHRNVKCALVAILQWLRRIVTVACVSALSLSLLSKNGLALVSHLYMHVFQFQNRNTPLHF